MQCKKYNQVKQIQTIRIHIEQIDGGVQVWYIISIASQCHEAELAVRWVEFVRRGWLHRLQSWLRRSQVSAWIYVSTLPGSRVQLQSGISSLAAFLCHFGTCLMESFHCAPFFGSQVLPMNMFIFWSTAVAAQFCWRLGEFLCFLRRKRITVDSLLCCVLWKRS